LGLPDVAGSDLWYLGIPLSCYIEQRMPNVTWCEHSSE
jgi:hypothetical protein